MPKLPDDVAAQEAEMRERAEDAALDEDEVESEEDDSEDLEDDDSDE